MTNFLEHLAEREKSLVAQLNASKAGISDATGKGNATELIIARELIQPNLPPQFGCLKGAAVSSKDPNSQSPAIDRIIYDAAAASPLVYTPDHSLFPIEAVAGLVEITMYLDTRKLRGDVERMTSLQKMRERFFVKPVANSNAVWPHKVDSLSPLSFLVGLPASDTWSAKDIAYNLHETQQQLGPPTQVNALYVLGVGCFITIPMEEDPFRILLWLGPKGLFAFTTTIRTRLDRWPRLSDGSSVQLDRYLPSAAPSAMFSNAGYLEG